MPNTKRRERETAMPFGARTKWATSNSRENLFGLRGEPSWIQTPKVPGRPSWKDELLMQLNSELPDTEGVEVYFGSGGISYVFGCDSDKMSGSMMQCKYT
jgi:hypothetical protein